MVCLHIIPVSQNNEQKRLCILARCWKTVHSSFSPSVSMFSRDNYSISSVAASLSLGRAQRRAAPRGLHAPEAWILGLFTHRRGRRGIFFPSTLVFHGGRKHCLRCGYSKMKRGNSGLRHVPHSDSVLFWLRLEGHSGVWVQK